MNNKTKPIYRDIYYIFATKPLLKYKTDQYIDYFKGQGYDVHVLDLSPILNPEAYELVVDGIIPDDEKIVFFNKKEFRRYMKKTPDGAMFFVRANYYFETYFVHKAIRKNQHYGYFGCANRAIAVPSLSMDKRMKNFIQKISLHRIAASVFHRIPAKYMPVKKADFVIMGGSGCGKEDVESVLGMCCYDHHTLIKYFHSSDYEDYLDAKKSERIIHEKYCVFIDQYLPYHPDNVQEGIEIEPKAYYNCLREFFEYIYNEYGIKVIISAHPRANMEHEKKLFSGYDVLKGKSAILVKDAEFVFTHVSTCLCLAPLFHKPFFIITTEGVKKVDEYNRVMEFTKSYLNCPLIDISENGWEKSFQLPTDYDHEKAVRYIREYVKADYNENIEDGDRFAVRLEKLMIDIMENKTGMNCQNSEEK